jgi:hypothetical protein
MEGMRIGGEERIETNGGGGGGMRLEPHRGD